MADPISTVIVRARFPLNTYVSPHHLPSCSSLCIPPVLILRDARLRDGYGVAPQDEGQCSHMAF